MTMEGGGNDDGGGARMTMEGGGKHHGIARPHKVDENVGVLRQGVRLAAACMSRGLKPPVCRVCKPRTSVRGSSVAWLIDLFSSQLAIPVATDTMEDENGGSLWRKRGCGRDARGPSLGPRSPIGVGDRLRGDDEERGRGDDGWGVTILACQAAAGVIFRGMTSEWRGGPRPRPLDSGSGAGMTMGNAGRRVAVQSW